MDNGKHRESTEQKVQTEEHDCPVCRKSSYNVLLRNVRDRLWGKPGIFQVQRCSQCGLVTTRPRPTAEFQSFYYRDTYTCRRKEIRFQTDTKAGRLIPRYRMRVLSKAHRLSDRDRLLDVGCSTGDFLRVARLESGCKVSGIELDKQSIDRALDPDETAYRHGTIEEQDFGGETFTVITFFQSLEHHRDPVKALNRAHALLAPGGICVVEVPNFGGFWRRVFRSFWMPLMVPQHLYHFDRKTMKKTLEAAGFRRILRHQTMFYPLEGVASLALWIWRVLRLPRLKQKDSFGWIAVPFVLILLAVLFIAVEIPSQAVLRLLGVSGHQITVAARD